MKLIEGLKKLKDLERKADDLRKLVKDNCAISSLETPKYGKEQNAKISEWIQAHSDILREILKLRIQIQKTNLITSVTIELNEKPVTKTLAEWIHRRRNLAQEELTMWKGIGDRGIKEEKVRLPGDSIQEVKIVRFYSPETRDKMVDVYISEPSIIDSRLEVVNAVTEIIEK